MLLVEFAFEGDPGTKDVTCQVDSKSHNLILPGEYYTRTYSNADHLPFLEHKLEIEQHNATNGTSLINP